MFFKNMLDDHVSLTSRHGWTPENIHNYCKNYDLCEKFTIIDAYEFCNQFAECPIRNFAIAGEDLFCILSDQCQQKQIYSKLNIFPTLILFESEFKTQPIIESNETFFHLETVSKNNEFYFELFDQVLVQFFQLFIDGSTQ